MKAIANIHVDVNKIKQIFSTPVNLILGVIYAAIALYGVNYLKGSGVSRFNRTFSPSLIAGIDYNSRIQGTYLYYFIVFPLLTIFFTFVIGYFFQNRTSKYRSLQAVSFLGAASILTAYICKYTDANASDVNSNSIISLLVIFAICLLIICLFDRAELVSEENVYKLFIANAMCILTIKQYIMRTDEGIRSVFSFFILNTHIFIPVILTALTIVLIMIPKLRAFIDAFIDALLMLSWIPFLTRVIIEIAYTIIGSGHSVQNIRKLTLGWAVLFFWVVIAILFIKITRHKSFEFSSTGYIGALMSLAALVSFTGYQQIVSLVSSNNIYELGNRSAATDSLWYGKLPIIDYFSAHALSDSVPRLFSATLNNEDLFLYASSSWDFLFTGLALIFLFVILMEFLGTPLSVIFVMLCPCSVGGVFVTTLCFMPVAASIALIKKKSWAYYFLWWIALAVGAFWSYDQGISIGIACILAVILLTLFHNIELKISRIIVSGTTVGGTLCLFFAVHCILQGISLIDRIKEWVSVSVGSSSSWGTAQIGNATSLGYFITYVFAPAIIVLILGILMYRVIHRSKDEYIFLPLMFALSTVLYINRTIVYHNLAVCNGVTGVALNYLPLSIVSFAGYISYKKEKSVYSRCMSLPIILICYMYVVGSCVTGIMPRINSSYYNSATVNAETLDIETDTTNYLGNKRVVLDEASQGFVNDFTGIFDTLLDDNQTYLDFANMTGLYGLVGRDRPSYVGQLPSLLTDLYTQEQFLNGLIDRYDAPIALLGNSPDPFVSQMIEISHNIRYYKIAEYIYQNYRPLIAYSGYTIWCKNEYYDEMSSKLEQSSVSKEIYSFIDYGFDAGSYAVDDNGNNVFSYSNPYAHSYNINQLPYIWANSDEYNAVDNTVIEDCEQIDATTFKLSGSTELWKNNEGNYLGNYLLIECNSSEEQGVSVIFRNNDDDATRYQYSFTVHSGTNKYLLRCSQDSFWYGFDINSVTVVANSELSVYEAKILSGD